MTEIEGHGSKQKKSALLLVSVSLLLILIYLLLSPFNIADGISPWLDTDYGLLTFNGLRILHGDLLYRDIWTVYTPANDYLVAFLYRAFGDNLLTLRVFLAFMGAATGLLVFHLTRSLTKVSWAIAAAAFTILLGPICVNYPYPSWVCVPLGLSMVALHHIGWKKKSNTYYLICGAIAGVIFSFKVNFGILAFSALVCMQSLEGLLDNEIPRGISLRKIAGTALVLAIWASILTESVVLVRNQLNFRNVFLFCFPAALALALGIVLISIRHKKGRPIIVALAPIFNSVLGFTSVIVPWVLFFLSQLGAQGFFEGLIKPLTLFPELKHYAAPPVTFLALFVASVIILQGIMILRENVATPIKAIFLALLILLEISLAYKAIPFFREQLLATGSHFYDKSAFAIASFFPPALLAGTALIIIRKLRELTETSKNQVHLLLSLWIYSVAAFHTFYPVMEPTHLVWNMPPIVVLGAVFMVHSLRFWKIRQLKARSVALLKLARFWLAISLPVFLVLFFGLPLLTLFVEIHGSPLKIKTYRFSGIDSPRDGILMDEQKASDLSNVIEFVRSHTEPGEYIFDATGSFFYFLTDRPNPTRWGHFMKGFVSSRDIAEIIEKLEIMRPRVAVMSYAADIHLSLSQPVLYAYLRARYKPVKTFGDYQVLMLNESQR